jgi:hypothetical protein
LSNGDANKCKFVNNFVLSLLVYLVLTSSAMVSFEFSPMSNELTNEFLLIDIFFLKIPNHRPFFVCLLLRVRRHVVLFLVFLCCYLQRRDNLNYNNVVGNGFFLVFKARK